MTFLVYLAVAVITIFSVLLEMNVFVEPTRHVEYAKLPAAVTLAEPLARPPQPATDARASDAVALPPPPPMQAVSGKCDVTACAAAYQSFRASDCTYQADGGRRELCTKGVASDPATAAAVLNAQPGAGSNASPACNVSACARAYISFTAADCTYQPSEGPRRLCTKQ